MTGDDLQYFLTRFKTDIYSIFFFREIYGDSEQRLVERMEVCFLSGYMSLYPVTFNQWGKIAVFVYFQNFEFPAQYQPFVIIVRNRRRLPDKNIKGSNFNHLRPRLARWRSSLSVYVMLPVYLDYMDEKTEKN